MGRMRARQGGSWTEDGGALCLERCPHRPETGERFGGSTASQEIGRTAPDPSWWIRTYTGTSFSTFITMTVLYDDVMEVMKIGPEERVLFIINDNAIWGSTRFQKYGFLLAKQYQREIEMLELTNSGFEFYNDWGPHYFGPFSRQLERDIETCINKKILKKTFVDKTPGGERDINIYQLTVAGRKRWRDIFYENDCMKKLDDKIKHLQKMSSVTLLRLVYNAYPEFTTNSTIKNSL